MAGAGSGTQRSEDVEMKLDELRKVKGYLHNLKAAGQEVTGSANDTSLSGSSGSTSGALGFYDLSTAVRMLTDYINDLRKSNTSALGMSLSVQTKINEYEALRDELRDELDEANLERDPHNSDTGRLLTPQERSKLILMLHDYEAVLEQDHMDHHPTDIGIDFDQPVDDSIRTSSTSRQDADNIVELVISDVRSGGDGVPLYLSDTHFADGVYTDSLTAVLNLCKNQVHEFTHDLLPSVVIFTHLCTYMVETLAFSVQTKFERFQTTLTSLTQRMDHREDHHGSNITSITTGSNFRNSVSFCFESLVGVVRRFQLVADLLRKCGSPESWHKSALELADVRPQKRVMRWSEFSLAIRNCEWSLDLVELAFHALEKLLTHGTYTVKDASFKWSPEKGRMVLQIPSKARDHHLESLQVSESHHDVESNGSLDDNDDSLISLVRSCKEFEEKDVAALIEKLEELVRCEKEKIRFYNVLPRRSVSNAHGIAQFLGEKLKGPTPEIGSYLPYSYSFSETDCKSLRYLEYLDKGSSGMVAIHEWYGTKVAVKSVRGLGLSRTKFEQEAAVLAMAQHPNVVRFIGCGFLEKSPHGSGIGQLVMELMDHDLRTIIDSRVSVLPRGSTPFSPIVAIDLMLQIAQAMLYLYERKILHRDLKAKNVLVNICKPLRTPLESDTANTNLMSAPHVSAVLPHTQENYVAKLADFGLAKCLPQSSCTMTTGMPGTTGWRAPEIFHVPDSDIASTQYYKWPADVYSFAMTAYEIVTGKLPFEDEPNFGLHGKIMAGMRPSFGNVGSDIPETVKEIIEECWATNPDDRPTFDYIVKKLWECKVLAILPGFERKIMDSAAISGTGSGLSTN